MQRVQAQNKTVVGTENALLPPSAFAVGSWLLTELCWFA